jgi:surface carbohydrate biosynthesis protein
MDNAKPSLLIPVELQVREFDPKLLLACVAARHGISSLIGPRREMHFRIPSFPRSIYVSKSVTSGSKHVFRILHSLGHKIVVWDEEALVSLPPPIYYRHRVSPVAIRYVSHMFAWGAENAELWRNYPRLPAGVPIHVTGNPRGDLLRPELRSVYEQDRKQVQKNYGNFILINTNFSFVNPFFPDMGLLKFRGEQGKKPVLTRRSKSMGLDYEYAAGFCDYKRGILNDFKQLIPALERSFPDYTIVIRPHPAENQEIYNQVASMCQRVRVVNKGNVVPWLLAAKVLIHNGCTTGVEASAIGVPAIAYRARVNDQFDRDFHQLPNELSHECFNFEQLQDTLQKILSGDLGAKNGDDCRRLFKHHFAAQEGPLACERVVKVLEKIIGDWSEVSKPAMSDRAGSWIWATRRRLKKRLRGYLPNMAHNRAEFLRHRYPEISLEDLKNRISQLQQLLGHEQELKIQKAADQFFQISF